MTAAAPKATESAGPSNALDKRRAKWLATNQLATEAEGTLAALNSELEANARRREASKAELESAVKRAAELEKELKDLAKQRTRLRADRMRAKRDVKATRRRAKVTEQKFDRALVKDLLRKAKAADLAAHKPPAVRAVTPRSAATPAKTARRRPAPATAAARRPAAAANGRS